MPATKTLLRSAIAAIVVCIMCSSCSSWWHPRWHSYDTKNGVKRHDHYDPYKKKWYKKRWRDGTIWK